MITKITLAFLKAVKEKENNNVARMDKNRDLYHMERDNFLNFSKELIAKTQKLDKNIGELEVKDATFRFNRDIRFSKDKWPYKGNFGVIIREEGKHGIGGWYYVHIEPGSCFVGWWIYNPPAPVLLRVRTYIAKHYKQLEKILNTPEFKKTFGTIEWEQRIKMPRWFLPNHKAGNLLKMLGRYASKNVSDTVVLQEDFVAYCLAIFKVLKPLNDFLNRACNS